MSKGRYIDDSKVIRLDYLSPKKIGKVEMANMIDTPLHFQTFFCSLSSRDGHSSRVVDQIINFGKGNAGYKVFYRLFAT
jgi:hypothetical protein